MKTMLVRDTLLPELANALFDFVLPRRIALIAKSSLDGEQFADIASASFLAINTKRARTRFAALTVKSVRRCSESTRKTEKLSVPLDISSPRGGGSLQFP
jgi:hypothetical protein